MQECVIDPQINVSVSVKVFKKKDFTEYTGNIKKVKDLWNNGFHGP